MKKAAIVVPTYNESESVKTLIERIFEIGGKIPGWELSILVVDSTSPDGTSTIVKKLQKNYSKLHLLVTEKEGLGKAYIRGFKYAIAKLAPDVLFEMDADLSHDPREIPNFLKKIDGGIDFVIGSRYIKGGSIPKDWGFHRKVFSVLGNLIIRFGFMKPRMTEWTNGYRAIKTWVVEKNISAVQKYSGYVFQVAMIDNALKNRAKFGEIPINFIDRRHGVSKINSIQYIAQTLLYVFRNSSFIKYVIVGLSGAAVDFGISYLLIERVGFHKNFYWLATLISAESALLSNFFLNNFWSFSHKRLEHAFKTYFVNVLKFNLIGIGALLIQALGIQMFTNMFGPSLWFVYKFFILALIIIPYSYILYNKVIWKTTK